MSKNKENNEKNIQTGNNDLLFPLLFGIIAVIVMAVISKMIGA